MLVLIVTWLVVAFAISRFLRAFARGRTGRAIWLLTCIVLFYPPLEVIASWSIFTAVGSLLGGPEVHRPHAPIDLVGVLGERSTCDWDCYSLLEKGFKKVEVQISGDEIQAPTGSAQYFVAGPGVFTFQLAKRSDPRCSTYLAWYSRLGLDTAEDVEGSLAANLLVFRGEQCLVSQREQTSTAEVNVLHTEIFHQTDLGILREYRTSIVANDHTVGSPVLLAEDKTFQLTPSWPVTRFITRLTDVSGFLRYERPPLQIEMVVRPGSHPN